MKETSTLLQSRNVVTTAPPRISTTLQTADGRSVAGGDVEAGTAVVSYSATQTRDEESSATSRDGDASDDSSRQNEEKSEMIEMVTSVEMEAEMGSVRDKATTALMASATKQRKPKIRSWKLGTLHFRLTYDAMRSALVVTIVKATELPPPHDTSVTSTTDPYVKLQLLPDKRHKVKTRVLRKTQNPVYDEVFTFYGIDPNQVFFTTCLHSC